MPDYSKGVIYKIVCLNPEIKDFYVGSTTDLKDRENYHKTDCCDETREGYNYKVYQFIRDNGNWENWEMIHIEDYPCDTRYQLESRERYYIETLGSTLNTRIPTRTQKERREDNREIIKEQNKIYHEKNREIILKKQKEYSNQNKEKIAEKDKRYREQNKEALREYSKQYKRNNKEKISKRCKQKLSKINPEIKAEKNKNYYEDNKEALLEKQKERREKTVKCDCGITVSNGSLYQHKKSKRHINLLKELNQKTQVDLDVEEKLIRLEITEPLAGQEEAQTVEA